MFRKIQENRLVQLNNHQNIPMNLQVRTSTYAKIHFDYKKCKVKI